MVSLNIIRDQGVNTSITQPTNIIQLDTYGKLVSFIHDSRFIRLGATESVRTVELARAFNNTMEENVAYQNVFPRLMKRLISEYSNLSIIKKTKNYGTIYQGIGLTTDPIPQEGTATLLQKETNQRYIIRDRAFLNKIKEDLCKQCGWTDSQYRQMGTLGIIKLIKGDKNVDINTTIYVTMGRLFEYIHENNLKLKAKTRYASNIKIAFEKAINWDATLSENNGTPVYTNRLLIAEETYHAGDKLQRAVNSYINRIQSLPAVNILSNPNIDELNYLITWLKSNSMHKTRLDMKIKQEDADPEIPQAVNWTLEDEIKEYDNDTLLIVDD